ncbi:MAG: hypothetical protein WC867_04075 [Candidatus Pacearchaeota archaeon]|jgi:hypothetical protein
MVEQSDNKSESKLPEKDVKIELKLDTSTLKISMTTDTSLENMDGVLDKLVNSYEKLESKIKKLIPLEDTLKTAKSVVEVKKDEIKNPTLEDPINKIALKLDLNYEKLNKATLFGIKSGKVQIIKTQKFTPKDALLVITFLYEECLGNPAIPYEELKEFFQLSNIKSGTPLYMIISNSAGAGYIDKQRYDSQKEITLTAKGLKQVKKIIEEALSS